MFFSSTSLKDPILSQFDSTQEFASQLQKVSRLKLSLTDDAVATILLKYSR